MQSTLQHILQPEIQQFIREHEQDDVRNLVLKQPEFQGVSMALIADQINGRRKAKDKLPAFYQRSDILYPPSINMEQCSSQRTAEFKIKLVAAQEVPLGRAADLTGGFGVDSWSLSRAFAFVDVVEQDENILSIARHNHHTLGATNLTYHVTDATTFLTSAQPIYDFIFVDPSRRTSGDKKVFKLSDCSPDVVSLQDLLFQRCTHLLVKTSPLLDLDAGLRELKFVRSIIVVSVEDECKEVLFFSQKGFSGDPEIVTVNLKAVIDTFSFYGAEEKNAIISWSEPLTYLYEPNASILKAGAFKITASRFGLLKIQPNTHLYTSAQLVSDFPGRIYKVQAFVKNDPKTILPYFPDGRGNVAVRNYPLRADELKKKSGLQDGGQKYLLGFSGSHKKYLAVADRLK